MIGASDIDTESKIREQELWPHVLYDGALRTATAHVLASSYP